MAFAQELKDFATSFQAGYNLVKSPEEKEAEAAKLRYMNTQADAAEYDLSEAKKTEPLRHRALELDNANVQSQMSERSFNMEQAKINAPIKRDAALAEIDNTRSLVESRKFQMEQDKANAPLVREDAVSVIEGRKATIASTKASTESQTLENNKLKQREELLKSIMKRKTGGATPAKPQAVPVDGAPGPQSSMTGGSLMAAARGAVKSGLLHNVSMFQIGGDQAVPAGGNERAQYAYLSGEGAEDPQYLEPTQQIVKQAAEAEGEELSPAELNLYTLAAMHELYLAEGDPEKAKKVAGAILQSYRMKAGQWAAVAKAASSKGDINGATMAIAKAYSFIPDGYDVSFKTDEKTGKIIVERTDIETGELVSKEVKHPREIFAMAMEVDPSVFDEALMAAAGVEATKADPVKASDIEHIETAASSAVTNVMGSIMPEGEEIPPDVGSRLTSATAGIIQANLAKGTFAPPEDVARVAWEMTVVDPEAPDAVQFGATEVEGGFMTHFSDGTEMFVPEQQFKQLMVARKKNANAARKALDEAEAKRLAAAKRKSDFTESITAARGALTLTNGSETIFDGTP